MSDREFVEQHWKDAEFNGVGSVIIHLSDDGFVPDEEWFDSHADAAAFTHERLEQIRQVKEEIKLIDFNRGRQYFPSDNAAMERIHQRLQLVLTELLRGMRVSE